MVFVVFLSQISGPVHLNSVFHEKQQGNLKDFCYLALRKTIAELSGNHVIHLYFALDFNSCPEVFSAKFRHPNWNFFM